MFTDNHYTSLPKKKKFYAIVVDFYEFDIYFTGREDLIVTLNRIA